jgi:uncharacterized membrane protein YcaP (DUF421 family)
MSSIEITSSWSDLALVVLSSILMLAGILAVVRLVGLRSFSKMTPIDFSVTLATGSVLAAVALSNSALVDGLVAVSTLLGVQAAISFARSRWGFAAVTDNVPMLLMAGPRMLDANLARSRVTADDLRAKLRGAGVRNFEEVRYVVLETTGDVSVVHGDGELDPRLLAGVKDAERLWSPPH